MATIINNNCNSYEFIQQMNDKFNIIDFIHHESYDFSEVCENVICSILGSYQQKYSSEIIHQLLFQLNPNILHNTISKILHLHLEVKTADLKKKSLVLLKKGKLTTSIIENNIFNFIEALQKIDKVFYLSNKIYSNKKEIYPYGKSFVVSIGLEILSTSYITNMKIANTIINRIIMNDNKKNEFIRFNDMIKNIGYYNESISEWFKIFISDIINKNIREIENNHPVKIYNKINNFLNIIKFIKKSDLYFSSVDAEINRFINDKLIIDTIDIFIEIISFTNFEYLILNFLNDKIDSIKFLWNNLVIIDDAGYQIKNMYSTLNTFLRDQIIKHFNENCVSEFDYSHVNKFIQIFTKVNKIRNKLNINTLECRIKKELNDIMSKNSNTIENFCKYIHFNITNEKVLINYNMLNKIFALFDDSINVKFIEIYKKYLIKRVTSPFFNEIVENKILNILRKYNNYKKLYYLLKIVDDVINSNANMTHYRNLEFIKTENLPDTFNKNKFKTLTVSYNTWDSIKNNNVLSENQINELYKEKSTNKSNQLLTYIKSYQIFYNKLYQKNHKITKWYIMNGQVKLDYNYESGTCELITLPIHTFILELFNNTDSISKKLLLNAEFWGNSNNKDSIMKNLTNSKILLFDGKDFKINKKWKPQYSPFNIINFSNEYDEEKVMLKERVISNQLVIESNILSIVKKNKNLNSSEIYKKVENQINDYFNLSKEEFNKSLDNLFDKEYIIATEEGIIYNTY